ncbi:UNVERIFIED_CONTAM: hypothetical protein HHA_452360 [Hammondia hammondi]|eukprot:XP_008885485.1 hypothetical protein HHA_452360 [Hammondia hammondi]
MTESRPLTPSTAVQEGPFSLRTSGCKAPPEYSAFGSEREMRKKSWAEKLLEILVDVQMFVIYAEGRIVSERSSGTGLSDRGSGTGLKQKEAGKEAGTNGATDKAVEEEEGEKEEAEDKEDEEDEDEEKEEEEHKGEEEREEGDKVGG